MERELAPGYRFLGFKSLEKRHVNRRGLTEWRNFCNFANLVFWPFCAGWFLGRVLPALGGAFPGNAWQKKKITLMEKPKILFVSQEIFPYTEETPMSKMGRYLPQGIQEQGNEIRTFMPRYGVVNERRNQLHEVIRLSGINLVINDTDHPLIIKVASIQSARMQIYFIDNEEFFYKRNMFFDNEGRFYEDNDEKCIFFARGVLETVKKLAWAPDIIHCSGWFASLLPLYVKRIYKDSPLFAHTKVITTLYQDGFEGAFPENFPQKLAFDNIANKDITPYGHFSFNDLNRIALDFSDGVIFGDAGIGQEPWAAELLQNSKKPILDYPGDEDYVEKINAFYSKFLKKKK